ncbi:hypothetical protein VNO77_30650 [Canavalia gladiata]|uniref:Uncharacterized protein n=1 Tax=Canavalia gladiata TaxID=3824 RepID=A0AAN9KP03_CANGL
MAITLVEAYQSLTRCSLLSLYNLMWTLNAAWFLVNGDRKKNGRIGLNSCILQASCRCHLLGRVCLSLPKSSKDKESYTLKRKR